MKISKDTFFSIGSEVKIPKERLEAFWVTLERQIKPHESSPFATYLFYFGAMIVISAMTWFLDLGWKLLGGGGVFLIATTYALALASIGAISWAKKELKVPAGLLITAAVCMVPLAIYGLETYFDIWPHGNPGEYQGFFHWVKESWIFMDIGAIAAGITALRFFSFPFLTAPIFFFSWFLALDSIPLLLGANATWEQKYWVSLCFGLVLIAIGFIIDRKGREEFGFWAYFFGTLAFWVALNCLAWGKGEIALAIFLIVNIVMMCFSIPLRRSVLMVFGALGVFSYLGHLAYDIFEDSPLFPLILSFLGLAIIYLGVLYQKNIERLEKWIYSLLPKFIKKHLCHKDDL